MAGKRVLLRRVLDQHGEPVHALAHVDELDGEVHLDAGRHDHHRAASCSATYRRTAFGSLPAGANTRRPSASSNVANPSGAASRSCNTSAADSLRGRPRPRRSWSPTVASGAFMSCPTLNCTRHRNSMLVTMPWRRQIAAPDAPGCSDSRTIASFSSSVNKRRFDRPSGFGSAAGGLVKGSRAKEKLAALLNSLLNFGAGRALGWSFWRQSNPAGSSSSCLRQCRRLSIDRWWARAYS